MNRQILLPLGLLCLLTTGCIAVPMPQTAGSAGYYRQFHRGGKYIPPQPIYTPQPIAPLYPGDPMMAGHPRGRERRLLKRLNRTQQKLAKINPSLYSPHSPYGGAYGAHPGMSPYGFGEQMYDSGMCGGMCDPCMSSCGDCCSDFGSDFGMGGEFMSMDGMMAGGDFGMSGGCSSCGTSVDSSMMSPGSMVSPGPVADPAFSAPMMMSPPAHHSPAPGNHAAPAPAPVHGQPGHSGSPGAKDSHAPDAGGVPLPMPEGGAADAHTHLMIPPSSAFSGIQQTGGIQMSRQISQAHYSTPMPAQTMQHGRPANTVRSAPAALPYR